MTDRADLPEPPDVDPDVELASALLDEEASADERARADDPAVQAHLDALRAVSARVGAVPPVPEGLLERHVDAALDAFDAGGSGSSAPVVPLDRRRATGRTWWQRAPLGAVAAVVAVVALVGAVGLASLGGDDSTDTAATAFDEPGAIGDSDDSGDTTDAFSATEEGATTEADDAAGGSERASRPEYADVDELADELAARIELRRQSVDADTGMDGAAAPTAGAPSDEAPFDPCDAVAVAGIDRGEVIELAPAIVDGAAVTAVVHGDPDAARLVVVDDGTCEVLVERDLPPG